MLFITGCILVLTGAGLGLVFAFSEVPTALASLLSGGFGFAGFVMQVKGTFDIWMSRKREVQLVEERYALIIDQAKTLPSNRVNKFLSECASQKACNSD